MAYADPPYIGCAEKHYKGHADFGGEVDHADLIARLGTFDAWALSLSCKSLQFVLSLCPSDVRVLAWTKPVCGFLPGIRVQYGWEPIIIRGEMKSPHRKGSPTLYDWIEAIPPGFTHTFRPLPAGHVIGRKPVEFYFWLFDVLGMRPGDEFIDLFPGSGAASRGWKAYREQVKLPLTYSHTENPDTRGPRAALAGTDAATSPPDPPGPRGEAPNIS